jgi:hypothetical protein
MNPRVGRPGDNLIPETIRPTKMLRLFPVPLIVLAAICGTPALAQDADPTRSDTTSPTLPDPNPDDVESIDAIIRAVYDVISGPADEERDWDRFRSLFVPDARLIPTASTPDGEIIVRSMSPDDYAARAAVFFRQPGGFVEREIGRKVDLFGNIAHVFSAYESLRSDEDQPFARGVNSFQLVNLGDRWAMVTVFWQQEGPENPIPDDLLFEANR